MWEIAGAIVSAGAGNTTIGSSGTLQYIQGKRPFLLLF